MGWHRIGETRLQDAVPGSQKYVMLKGGQVFEWALVQQLLAIEERGGRFTVDGETITLSPSDAATPEEFATLKARKPDVLRILAYTDRICAEPLDTVG